MKSKKVEKMKKKLKRFWPHTQLSLPATVGVRDQDLMYLQLVTYKTKTIDNNRQLSLLGDLIPFQGCWQYVPTDFDQSANFQVHKNGTLSARNQKRRPPFHVNIPSNGEIDCFKRLPLLDELLADIEKEHILSPSNTDPKLKWLTR